MKIKGILNPKRWMVTAAFAVALILAPASAAFAAQSTPVEDMLPDSTKVFVSVKNAKELKDDFFNHALYKFYKEESVQDCLKGALEKIREGIAEAEKEFNDETGLKFSDMTGLFDGQAALFLQDVNIAEEKFSVGFYFDFGDGKKNADKVFGTLLEKAKEKAKEDGNDATFEKIKIAGQDVWKISKNEKEPVVQYVVTERFALIEISNTKADIISSYLNNLGKGAIDNSLSKSATFKTVRQETGADSDVFFYLNGKSMMELIRGGFIDEKGEDSGEMFDKVVDALGVGNLEGLGLSLNLSGKETSSCIYIHCSSELKGLLKLLSLNPIDANPPKFVPAEAVNYISAGLDAKEVWDEVKKAATSDPTFGMMFAGGLMMLNGKLGFDLEKDLINVLGKEATYYCVINEPFDKDSAHHCVVLDLRDGDKFLDTYKKILKKSGAENMVKESEYLKQTVYTVEMAGMEIDEDEDGGNLKKVLAGDPSFCIMDGKVLISSSKKGLQGLMDNVSKGAKNPLASSDAFKKRAKSLPEKPSLVAYKRYEALINYAAWALKNAKDNGAFPGIGGEMLQEQLAEFGVDLSKLKLEDLNKYVDDEIAFMSATENGLKIKSVHYSK